MFHCFCKFLKIIVKYFNNSVPTADTLRSMLVSFVINEIF